MRGEYPDPVDPIYLAEELPPRARRIHSNWVYRDYTLGTTSACAENTLCWPARLWQSRNYLRVRGEYWLAPASNPHAVELPPRARRIRCGFTIIRIEHGTTSACAENTERQLDAIAPWRNYLRVRGEYCLSSNDCPNLFELPPRARRIRLN